MGPTATGKTALAIEIAQRLPCDIISVDSGMIYRGMDVGTAKPTREELMIAPHRLIDICDPATTYSVGQFCHDAAREIDAIVAQQRIPLLVGGTMMYFHALQQGIASLPQANPEVRKKISAQAQEFGWEYLHRQLMAIDPQAAKRISLADSQRIQRALEIFELTGKSITELQQMQPTPVCSYEILNIALVSEDKDVLWQRIQWRFQQMWQQGFMEEVQKLYQRSDLHADLPAIRTVGYRQIWEYLQGKLKYEEMLERIPIVTRQLAKRQLTWLRKWQDIYWLNSADPSLCSKTLNLIKKISAKFKI